MLARMFRKTGSPQTQEKNVAINRLTKLGIRSALCTRVRAADGRLLSDEVGSVSFYRQQNQLFTRGDFLFLAPPEGFRAEDVPFSGRGEILNFKFYHDRTPYSLDCQVVQRVRFSDKLLGGMKPRLPVAYKLTPVSTVKKNERRSTLRFAHLRGVPGPQVSPSFRFDLFVERVRIAGPAHQGLPEVIPFPGDEAVPIEVQDCETPEEMVAHFHRTLNANPIHLQKVHFSKAWRDTRSGAVDLLDLGYTPVLGLRGKKNGSQIHLRCPGKVDVKDRKSPERLKEGDVIVLRYVGRGMIAGQDTHYRWVCRVKRCGLENLVVRAKGPIQKQTGLPVLVRDFGLKGISIQNSPLLETFLLDNGPIPDAPEAIISRLEGMGLLLHFCPRMHFINDLESYCPSVPASFSILGEIIRGRVDPGKDEGRINEIGVEFKYDPIDYGWDNLYVKAWEPLRSLRENRYFKEIHRALNAMLAYTDR